MEEKPLQTVSTSDYSNQVHSPKLTITGIFVIVFAFMVFFGLYAFTKKEGVVENPFEATQESKVEKFANEEDFRNYLARAKSNSSINGFGANMRAMEDTISLSPQASFSTEKDISSNRYSQPV